jgi:acyl-CoA synthetase (AMP-forming)/AMP-acid ligase II
VPRAGAALREETLRDFCRERLARHKIPKRISIVSELPKTSSGKILRRAIREPGS